MIDAQVKAGKGRDEILRFCSRVRGVNEFTLSQVEGTVERLRREKVNFSISQSVLKSPQEEIHPVNKGSKRHYCYTQGPNMEYGIVDRHIRCSRDDGLLEIIDRQKKVDGMLNELARRWPWIFIGYNDDMAASWKYHRNAVIRAVDERRQQAGQPSRYRFLTSTKELQ